MPMAKGGSFQFKMPHCEVCPHVPRYDPIITRNMNSIDTQFATRRNVALQPGTLQAALLDRLTRSLGKNRTRPPPRDIYDALSIAVREELAQRWIATHAAWPRRTSNASAICRWNSCSAAA